MVRRVAGPDAATGKSCCRSGFSRELLLGPQGSRLPPLLQGQMPGSRAQAAVIDVFTQSRPLALAAYRARSARSEEHTSELQSLMRISYAVFCLKKKKKRTKQMI